MGWFGKKNDVLDLTERYKKQQEKIKTKEVSTQSNTASNASSNPFGFGIFGMQSSQTTTAITPSSDEAVSDTDKRKKLAKRIMEMTDKLEELSNQIYHLQQRVEVLEKKSDSGRF